jgi:hypothetical protein
VLVLNRVANLVRGNRNCGQGTIVIVLLPETHGSGIRVVVIAAVGGFHANILKAMHIQQVTCKFCT